MKYTSTRDSSVRVSAAKAIAAGISPDGGLFVPCEIPVLTKEDISLMCDMDYPRRAAFVIGKYLDDYTQVELLEACRAAYSPEKFGDEDPCPISCILPNEYILELWHGPTCAFKDMALQLLPRLLAMAVKKEGISDESVILVATSGDTGKAALEGFCDVEGTRIIVYFPNDGVSKMQKLQMTTQKGKNTGVCAIDGNFDDAQNGVKKIFAAPDVKERLSAAGMRLTSANSINWGRLVPQIAYYVSAYCNMVAGSEIENGDEVNVCVPTGNFGNILAAWYAKKMGIPIKKLICASNANNVLTDFLSTGIYDKNRPFYMTSSPSMDILISSNLERLLYHLSGDCMEVKGYMELLGTSGRYEVSENIKELISTDFACGFCTEEQTAATINRTFTDCNYLCDTHTAVAVHVYSEYLSKEKDGRKVIVASTANPYKFADRVYAAVTGEECEGGGFEIMDRLNAITDADIPVPLSELRNAQIRHKNYCEPEDMVSELYRMLGA